MKPTLLFAASALLFIGCSREASVSENVSGEQAVVTIEAGLPENLTRAVSDYDGNAKQVDHWVMEVRDKNGKLFTRQETNPAKGTLKQTFTVALFKNNTYTFQFWADKKGSYNTSDLTAVSTVSFAANDDSRDAFSANVEYTSTEETKKLTATLYRPFAQINIQTTDLPKMWSTAASEEEYYSFKPVDLKFTAKVPTSFNVKTQTVGTETASVDFTAAECYYGYEKDSTALQDSTTYYRHVNPATLCMDYVFASAEKSVVDIEFSFKSNGNAVDHKFTSVPYQRNYRTNIRGKFMSDDTEWTVTIDPAWKNPDYEYPEE